MTDYGLNEKTCNRCRDPQYGYIVDFCTESLKDTAHIAVLKGKSELDAQKAKTHVPYLPSGEPRLASVDHIHGMVDVSFQILLKIS
jgi:hypothetical protein